MARTVEAPHDLDRCPVCRNDIDPEALLCAACGAEKITINDGNGNDGSAPGCLGVTFLFLAFAIFVFAISRFSNEGMDLMDYAVLAVSVGAAILGLIFLGHPGSPEQKDIKETTRPAWKHVSASEVVAAHERAEAAAEKAAEAADRAASEARKPARRSFLDQLTDANRD